MAPHRMQRLAQSASDSGVFEAAQSLSRTTTEGSGVKAIITSVVAVGGQLLGFVDQAVILVLVLWLLDMLAGTAHAILLPSSNGWRAEKARAGALRGVIYLIAVSAAGASAAFLQQVGGPDLTPFAIWAVCSWVAIAELGSIGRHVDAVYPGLGKVLSGILDHIPKRKEDRERSRPPRTED